MRHLQGLCLRCVRPRGGKKNQLQEDAHLTVAKVLACANDEQVSEASDEFLLASLYLRIDEERWNYLPGCEEDTLP